MVFGNCGVLSEINPSKGFVEMSGIDPETSQDINEVCKYYNFCIIFNRVLSSIRYQILESSLLKTYCF